MECFNCGKQYIAYDSDAGTYKEHFCSEKCEQEMDAKIDKWQRGSMKTVEQGESYSTFEDAIPDKIIKKRWSDNESHSLYYCKEHGTYFNRAEEPCWECYNEFD